MIFAKYSSITNVLADWDKKTDGRFNLLSKAKTHCSKCGKTLVATNAIDGGSYGDYVAEVIFTCPSQRFWNRHDKEYFTIPLWNYKKILSQWAKKS